MSTTLPILYPITDVSISGLSHAKQVELLAAAGATLIQLRDKEARPHDFYEAALKALDVGRALGVTLVINDRVDLAIAVGADGVHLGQDDLAPSIARRLLGESRIIGYSTHTMAQAVDADIEPVDYIAIGPVYETSTKMRSDPVVGLESLGRIKQRIHKPLVAIGGITLDCAPEVLAAGADSLAVISDVYSGEGVNSRVKAYFQLAENPV